MLCLALVRNPFRLGLNDTIEEYRFDVMEAHAIWLNLSSLRADAIFPSGTRPPLILREDGSSFSPLLAPSERDAHLTGGMALA